MISSKFTLFFSVFLFVGFLNYYTNGLVCEEIELYDQRIVKDGNITCGQFDRYCYTIHKQRANGDIEVYSGCTRDCMDVYDDCLYEKTVENWHCCCKSDMCNKWLE